MMGDPTTTESEIHALVDRFPAIETWQREMTLENEHLQEKLKKAAKYVGMKVPGLKTERCQAPGVSDAEIDEMCKVVQDRAEVKKQKVVRDAIITAMSEDLTKKLEGYTHRSATSWMNFSETALDKIRSVSIATPY